MTTLDLNTAYFVLSDMSGANRVKSSCLINKRMVQTSAWSSVRSIDLVFG
ncbi:unnamed protein product [Periconia digitata]|uniref:Uncharacterized protein n=1 Tax=Periconia digitata TaxID=1303443 RepID=A0A9W4XTD6_9PLEO|nr:unnamed protein product [Periconia digitata]